MIFCSLKEADRQRKIVLLVSFSYQFKVFNRFAIFILQHRNVFFSGLKVVNNFFTKIMSVLIFLIRPFPCLRHAHAF
jgi:hypothetical protein